MKHRLKAKGAVDLLLGFSLYGSGCAGNRFSVTPDQTQLTQQHRFVAEVTCLEAKPVYYTTFRDQYFRLLAMPPHVRWSAIFRVDKAIKGPINGESLELVDGRDGKNPYSGFRFETGKTYTIGFSSICSGEISSLAVLGKEPSSF